MPDKISENKTSENKSFYYTSTHEWIKKDDDNNLTIGITDHAQKKLGDLVFVELPEVGQQVNANDECVVVESVKAAADVYAPVSGEISEINQDLENEPERVNSDPYLSGWLYKITPNDKHNELNENNIKELNWMNFDEYQELLEEES
jgi:glycine cleavage system H protein